MNSRELVAAALRGETTPRVPKGPLAVHYCAGCAGHTLRGFSSDANALADSVLCYYERFKPDAVWISADTWVSAEAMGAQVCSTGDDQPFGGTGEALVKTVADIENIPRPDLSLGRYPMMLKAVRRVREALGKDVFIVACLDQYPFSLAAALMDINEIMVKLFDDAPFVEALMQRCVEYSAMYGAALAEAGADMLSGGDSPAGLVGPSFYEEYVLPTERQLITKLHETTKVPVSLHICGNSLPILPDMATSGADVLELDHAVRLADACRIVGPETAIWGNLDPVSLLSRGTPEQITEIARAAMETVRAADRSRFVLSSGCTLAVDTPAQNIEALLKA